MIRKLSLIVALLAIAPAQAWKHGDANNVTTRTAFNLNFLDVADYPFIDMLQNGDNFPSQHLNWTLTAPIWNSGILDANGWPCTNLVNANCPYGGATNPAQGSKDFGGGLHIPAGSNYSGDYCLQGLGSGTISLNANVGGAFTKAANGTVTCAGFNASANNCTSANVTGTGPFTVTDETWVGWCIAVTYSGPVGAVPAALYVSSDDPSNSGHYVKALHFYEQPDGSDFAAGKLFRASYKSQIVTLDPAFIRFLNWNSNEGAMRFTDRPTPTTAPYAATQPRFAGQLPYAAATVTANTQYTVAAVTGTSASMLHGEQLMFIAPNNGPGVTGNNNVSAISVAGTTVTMTVLSNTVFTTGDTVTFTGMPVGDTILNYFYQTSITVDSATQIHFTFANAASVATCSSSCGTVGEGYKLQVGSGNDRTMYPLFDSNGRQPFGVGSQTVSGNSYRLCFSKTITGQTDGSGNWQYGAWYACGIDVAPIEYQVALVNELNAMGPVKPINIWISTPVAGLVCSTYYSDPDCSAAVDWPVGLVKTVLNGANGFSGLCSQCSLIVEDVNETWNGTSSTGFLEGMGGQPATVGKVGCNLINNINAYSTIHSELVVNDIQTSGQTQGRVKYTLGGWMWVSGQPAARITGTGLSLSSCQPQPVTGASAPITIYDYMNLAPYLDGTTVPSIMNNLAALAATWGSDVTSFGFNSSQALADLAAWTGPMTTDTSNGAQTIANAESVFLSVAATIAMYGNNKAVISYEGWWDDPIATPSYISSLSCTSGTVTVQATGGPYSSPMVIQGVSIAGYNGVFTTTGTISSFTYTAPGGTCPGGTPSSTNYQGYYGYVMKETDAFLLAAKSSSAWSTDYQGFLTYVAQHANMGMPGFFVQVDARWGVAFPDTYGATTTEGNGNDPTWTMMGTFNRAQAN